MNKRGQELSVTAIILIVIGVLVLVMLIIGFTVGWSKIIPWIQPSNNVKEIADSCKLACSTQNIYDYCTYKRTLHIEQTISAQTTPIKTFEDKIAYSCQELLAAPGLGIQDCSTICPKTCIMLSGAWQTKVCDTNTLQDITLSVTDTADKAANQGKYCCKAK